MSEFSTVEQGEALSFSKLRGVMEALNVYNQEHSFGAMFASALSARLDKSSEGESEDERRRRQSLSDAIKANNDARSFGLELNFGDDKDISIFTSAESDVGEISHPMEIRIYVEEGEVLLKFLKKINKVDFEKYPDLKNDISTIIRFATRQLVDSQSTEEKIASLVSVGTEILDEFERLGFGNSIEDLSDVLNSVQTNILTEFRALRSAQCLVKPDARVFGPSDWHTDTVIEEYKEKWSQTKRVVLEALQNKNATMLARKAIENLIANANYAIKNMEAENAKRHPEYLIICEEYKAFYEGLLLKIEEPELN